MQSEAYGGSESIRLDWRAARGWSRCGGNADRPRPGVLRVLGGLRRIRPPLLMELVAENG
jgi:hypothetical protein